MIILQLIFRRGARWKCPACRILISKFFIQPRRQLKMPCPRISEFRNLQLGRSQRIPIEPGGIFRRVAIETVDLRVSGVEVESLRDEKSTALDVETVLEEIVVGHRPVGFELFDPTHEELAIDAPAPPFGRDVDAVEIDVEFGDGDTGRQRARLRQSSAVRKPHKVRLVNRDAQSIA